MKIVKIGIHNYRGIHDASFNLANYNLLVGPNNSGKSTVLDAIRAFYEKDGVKFKPDRDLPFIASADTKSWMDISFRLTDGEDASLAADYRRNDKTLSVRKVFKDDDKSRDGVVFGYRSDGSLSTDPFYGAKNVQTGKFGDIVFIPAISKVDEHTKLTGPSALRDLLTNVLEAVVVSNPSYEQFSSDLGAFAQSLKIEKTADGRSLASLEAELNQMLQSWDTTFQVEMKSPSIAEIIKTLLSYDCVDTVHGKALPADQFGSGFQRHFIYSLIQLGAKYGGKAPSKKAKDFTPSMTLILFEEPEAFLHPPQQEALAESLAAIAVSPDQQALCSTHSPHFVSRNAANIPAIVRMKRDNGRVSAFQIDANAWNQIVDGNQSINEVAKRWPRLARCLEADDLKPDMEAVKYCLWLNPDRCGMFFANHVLIVEGPTEQAFINKLLGDGRIRRPSRGLHVLDSIGKYNMHRFMNLLTHLGIPHSVLYDDDNDKGEHADLNQLIRDSKSAFSIAVTPIAGDLETFLAVPKPKSDHRKPQHLLYLYESSQIAEDRLREFCALVEGALPEASALVDQAT